MNWWEIIYSLKKVNTFVLLSIIICNYYSMIISYHELYARTLSQSIKNTSILNEVEIRWIRFYGTIHDVLIIKIAISLRNTDVLITLVISMESLIVIEHLCIKWRFEDLYGREICIIIYILKMDSASIEHNSVSWSFCDTSVHFPQV